MQSKKMNEEFQDTIQSLLIEIDNIKEYLEEIYGYDGEVKKLFENSGKGTYIENKVKELNDKIAVFNWWWKVVARDVEEMKGKLIK